MYSISASFFLTVTDDKTTEINNHGACVTPVEDATGKQETGICEAIRFYFFSTRS